MRKINERYTTEAYDEQGVLCEFSLQFPEDYNFAYDVVDDIAAAEPDRPAMVWCNPEGEEHILSFGDMKYWSDKTANLLVDAGVVQGDLVLAILRRHYQFWFVALALDKLGAVIVPATFMLKEHDLEYRVNSAGIKTIICTDVGEIAGVIDAVLSSCPTLERRLLVAGLGGEELCDTPAVREGWIDFNTAVRAASPDFKPRATLAKDPMIMYFSSGTSGNPKMVLHDSSYSLAHL
ncbi:MAG: AMP-binding protein, partial [Coriobacteriales bacterium]|nr:AMP-binding protein [Coriobacteriales bacterium]